MKEYSKCTVTSLPSPGSVTNTFQRADVWEKEAGLPSTLREIREEALENWSKYSGEELPQNVLLSPYQVPDVAIIVAP